MSVTRHLDDEEITAAVAGLPLGDESRAHLHGCGDCAGRVSDMLELVEGRRRLLQTEAPDWQEQQRQVLARLPLEPPSTAGLRRRRWRPLLAAAAAGLAAFGLSVLDGPNPASRTDNLGGMAVEEVLAEVDAVLDNDIVPGFEVIDPGLDEPEDLVNDTT